MNAELAQRPLKLLTFRFGTRADAYLREPAECVKEPLTRDVLAAHLQGLTRVGIYQTEVTRFIRWDFDGKNCPRGADEAWEQLQAVEAVLVQEQFPEGARELTRSGVGYAYYLFFGKDDQPRVCDVKNFGRAVLRAAGLPDDEDEHSGHPGVYPWGPGDKGYGRTCFLPWSGLLEQRQTGIFLDRDRVPVQRQEDVLENIETVRRSTIQAVYLALMRRGGMREPSGNTKREHVTLEVPTNGARHDRLRDFAQSLAYKAVPEDETRTAVFAIGQTWGIKADRQTELEAIVRSAYDKAGRAELQAPARVLPVPLSLYDAAVKAEPMEYDVENLLPRRGLTMLWAPPSAGKTYIILRAEHELLMEQAPSKLFGHPDLTIRRAYKRVLFISTEESTGRLRSRGDMVLYGLGIKSLAGELLHVFAAEAKARVTILDLPALIETHGPFDAIVLDSLTGLRPKVLNGVRIKWDADSDAANDLLLELRGIAHEHNTCILIVHHTGRDTARGYRGPMEWMASVDVMFGLIPEEDESGHIKVRIDKNRDGKRIKPFLLRPSWGADGYYLTHAGEAKGGRMTPTERAADIYLRERGEASQAEIMKGAGIGSRTTITDITRRRLEAGGWIDTGRMDRNSIIFRHSGGSE